MIFQKLSSLWLPHAAQLTHKPGTNLDAAGCSCTLGRPASPGSGLRRDGDHPQQAQAGKGREREGRSQQTDRDPSSRSSQPSRGTSACRRLGLARCTRLLIKPALLQLEPVNLQCEPEN